MIDLYRMDAVRHREKAASYVAAGKPEFAVGSVLKAVRAERRARELEYEISGVKVVDDLKASGLSSDAAQLVAVHINSARAATLAAMSAALYGA